MRVEQVAAIVHEANRAYCKALGDESQVPWDEAPDWQRDSAISGVRAVITGQALTPKQQHDAWLNHKRNDGWTWGPVKDAEKKQHPCMVPYIELPVEQRLKDELFRAIVTTIDNTLRIER